ncbi:MAG: aspartate kinase [Oligoflexia bacterium]|nr:aspartate kinase [Oligoflexia bacterium]
MRVVVKKFGGTSVGDISRIREAAKLVVRYRAQHPEERLVVVVSAMAGETNRLLALARSCSSNATARELDMIAATGEQVTIALMAMALTDLGAKAESLTGAQAGVITTEQFMGAQVERIDTARLESLLAEDIIPVVAGFQGLSESREITTLGRGGSDISAVALAAALEAAACYIYTDVEGVFSADPRICPDARLLRRISHEEMLELATLGAKVLHPRSVLFAMRYRVPLVTLSTFRSGPGTWIVNEGEIMEAPVVSGITHRSDEARITLSKVPGGLPDGLQRLGKVFADIGKAGIPVDMLTQNRGADGLLDLSFTVPDEHSSHCLELCQALVPEIGAEGAGIDRNIAKVSVVGVGIHAHADVASKIFKALASERIEVLMLSTSEIKISVVIPRKYAELAVRCLHDALVLAQLASGSSPQAEARAAVSH